MLGKIYQMDVILISCGLGRVLTGIYFCSVCAAYVYDDDGIAWCEVDSFCG